ncbi:hypothetical protein BH10PSE15_BH10PSE15_04630 [soil metagenome]
MLGWTALVLQVANVIAPDVRPAHADAASARCPSDADGDIVVCGKPDQQESYRLRPLPERYVQDRQVRLKLPGGGTITPHADQGRLGDLQAKVTLRIPF